MAQYKAGTATVTNGSAVVTGIGTEFQTNGIAVGHRWARNGDNVTYAIASVDSETQITLNTPYAGVTNASAVYTIGKDVTVFHGYPLLFSGDIETATFLSYAIQRIDEDIASSLDGEFISFNSPTGTIAATSVSGAIRELEDTISFLSTGHFVLLGQAGGQQAFGGTGSGENLTLNSTTHANLGFVMLGGATGLVYDELNGLIGINESAPLGKLHVRSFDSGTASASVDADELVLENNLNAGLSILSGSSSSGVIAFGDSSNAIIGRIEYSHVSNSMTMYTNSIFAIHIDSSQNVGIGEATPGSPLSSSLSGTFLHVTSASSTRCIIEGGIAYLDLIDNNTTADNGWLSIANSGGKVTFSGLTDTGTTNVASILAIDLSDGDIGIGESVPLGKLHVKSADNGGTVHASADELVIEGTGSVGLSIITDNTGASNIFLGDAALSTICQIGYNHSSNNLVIVSNGSTAMTIDSNRNFGIGETVPLGKLHVKTSDSGAAAASSAADEFIIEGSTSSGMTIFSGTASIGSIMFGDSGSPTIGRVYYDHSINAMSFWTNATQRITIDSAGEVGIGATSPSGAMLDIRQTSSVGAKAVIKLSQSDVSEDMIDFIGTVATGNPIEAVGAKSLTTTHFVRVAINGAFRYIQVGTIA